MELPPQPHLGSEHLAEGHRRRLALAPFAPHNPAMPPDLSENDKAILVELLKAMIEADRFPRAPRVKRLRGILAKLDPPAPRSEPLPPPKPPGEPSLALRKRRR